MVDWLFVISARPIIKCQHVIKVKLIANYKVQETKVWMYIQKDNKQINALHYCVGLMLGNVSETFVCAACVFLMSDTYIL